VELVDIGFLSRQMPVGFNLLGRTIFLESLIDYQVRLILVRPHA
jgi:hypothetical protein